MYLVGGKHWLERETRLPILTERLVKRKGPVGAAFVAALATPTFGHTPPLYLRIRLKTSV